MAQKQKLLKEAIDDTKEKLETLKQADKQAKKQLESGDLGQDKYNALQREIIETKNNLSDLQKQQKQSTNFSVGLTNFGNAAKSASEKTKGLSTAAAGLLGAMTATVPATEELRTDLSKLDNNAKNAGIGIDETREAFKKFNTVSDETDSSVEATSNLLQAGFTESNLQKAVEGLSGAYLKFPDTLKIESLADSLQETLATGKATGQFGELLDRLGIGAENFSNNLAGLSTETEKQNYVLETLANAGLVDTYNGWIENNEALVKSKEASMEFQTAIAELAEVIAPIITAVTEVATKLVQAFMNLSPTTQTIILAIVGLVAALSPLLGLLGTAASLAGALGIGLLPLIGIIAAVVAAIIGLIAIIKNWGTITDWISKKWESLKNFVSNVSNSIKETAIKAFTKMVDGIKSTVSNIGSVVERGFESAISFITSLPSKAVKWGKDFIGGLIDGIKSMIGKVTGAVKGVAEKITSFLHFSRPDEGPLHYYETWMPDFMEGLADGIYKNIPKVAKAAKAVASAIDYSMVKESPTQQIDYGRMYKAVKAGASDSSTVLYIGDRPFKRTLKGMGVVFEG